MSVVEDDIDTREAFPLVSMEECRLMIFGEEVLETETDEPNAYPYISVVLATASIEALL